MTATAHKGLNAVLEPLIDEGIGQLMKDWARRKPFAIKKVNRILASANLTMDAVIAHSLSENIDFIERIERLIAVAETRRNAILREIDRHRASLAGPLGGSSSRSRRANIKSSTRNRLTGVTRRDQRVQDPSQPHKCTSQHRP
jgi:hypothetical protein